jgi:LysM repeat protein
LFFGREVKMKKMAVAVSAAALGGLVLAGGCSPSKVMDNRGYIPLEEDYTPLATESVPAAVPATPAAVPAADEAKKADLPKFNSAAIKHTGPITSAAAVAGGGSYVVKSGDTLGGIAHANGVSVQALLAANNMTEASAKKLKIGQKLTIPAAGKAVKSASAKAATAAKATASAAAATVDNGVYAVKAGDSIAVIAKRLKVKQSELMAANNMTEASAKKLQIGQKLKVPGAAATVSATVSTPDLTAPMAVVDTMVPATTDSGITAAPAGGPATSMTMDTSVGSSKPMEVEKDITLDEFAKQNKLGVDALKKLNPDIAPDGQLKAGDIIFVPEN